MNIIFENDLPKGSFWANKKKVEFLLLSPDSRKLLTTSLNKLAESTFVQSNGHLSSGERARNKERTSYFPMRRWHAPRRLVALFLSSTKFEGDVFSLVNASTRLESDVKSNQRLLPTMWFLTILEEVYWRANQSYTYLNETPSGKWLCEEGDRLRKSANWFKITETWAYKWWRGRRRIKDM